MKKRGTNTPIILPPKGNSVNLLANYPLVVFISYIINSYLKYIAFTFLTVCEKIFKLYFPIT